MPGRPSQPKDCVADRFSAFGTTIFAEMTRLAIEHDAINLSQGFPDFDGPGWIKDAAIRAIRDGHNQYPPTGGTPELALAIADAWRDQSGLDVDPARQVTVTSGCTEALAAAFLGLVNPGDEVVLFEPFYDSYRACVAMAGGIARFVQLRASEDLGTFQFDANTLREAFNERTKVVLLNTPHNPTGKVFTLEEMTLIAQLCVEHDVIAVTDEVYEHLVFDGSHIRLATLPGMAERTLTLSSMGKTFSLTGWKVGWAIGSAELTRAVRAAHQFLTFTTATPLQHAAAAAIRDPGDSITRLLDRYRQARDFLCAALSDLGFRVYIPAGTYFIMADHTAVSGPLGIADDAQFCRYLTTEIGVAAIPPGSFYSNPADGGRFVRFAFCKRRETLEAAVERLQKLRP